MEALKGLYHADKLDEQSFINSFTIRLKEYQQVMDSLNRQQGKPLQSFLITGKRGMGKSTLLRRIFIEANKSPLDQKMFAVRLGTEQYRISRLFKLWEEVIKHLENKIPEIGDQKKAIAESSRYEESLLLIIKDHLLQSGKTLLLLIDNFDQFINKLTINEQHALREALIEYPIQIIGNAVFYDEHFISYGKPFYDFFKPLRLENLDKEEAELFIKMRAAEEGITDFEEVFERQKGKITTLRILSGGVPRTLLILLGIISKNNTGNAVDYLHEMIEQVTPLYQDRMKSLSPQQQEIMHHLGMRWDRTPVKELAADMRVPSKSISAQLVQLEKSGYINKINTNGRNHYYEIDERFFNIWLLMSEAAPHDTRRVLWLTKWLDAFYSTEELADYAQYCHNGFRIASPANRFLIAQALSESEKLRDDFKAKLVSETAEALKDKISEVELWAHAFKKKLSEKEIAILKEFKDLMAIDLIDTSAIDQAFLQIDDLEKINRPAALFMKGCLFYKKNDIHNAEINLVEAVENGNINAMYVLGIIYEFVKQDIELSEKYYLKAVEKGHIESMYRVAEVYKNKKNNIDLAEQYSLMAIEKGNVDAMLLLAKLYENDKQNIDTAEKYYLMAVQQNNVLAMNDLGWLYWKGKNDVISAEKYFLMAAENGDEVAVTNLSIMYFNNNMIQGKEKSYNLIKRVAEKNQQHHIVFDLISALIYLWNGKVKEAEHEVYRILDVLINLPEENTLMSVVMTHFIVFKQKTILYKIFLSNKQLIDRYKPVYFALMHEMQDEYPKEFLKMPPELEETVQAILSLVGEDQKRLGLL